MRILLLADRSFATREHAMLARLQVGLADEGCRVVRALPGTEGADADDALGAMVFYDDRPTFAPTSLRAGALLQTVGRFGLAPAGHDDRAIDVIHVFGDGAWRLARALAGASGATVAFEVASHEALVAAPRIDASHKRGDQVSRDRTVWLAPDAVMETAIRTTMPGANVRLTPWGVHVPGEIVAFARPAESLSAAIVGSGRQGGACQALLMALARIAKDHGNLFLFLDDAFVHAHHGLWKVIENAGLARRLSVIENIEGRREPVMHADLLIQPESHAGHRSIVLDALAAGMAVVARRDDEIDALRNGRALLVENAAAAAWEASLRTLLADIPAAKAMGLLGREFIRAERLASAHLRAVLNAYSTTLASPAAA
jgi:hypothetical protein